MDKTKNVWILNHYTKPPSISRGNRHSKFGKYLTIQKCDVTLFCSSTYSKGQSNIIQGKESYLIENSEDGKYVILKTRNYYGNGIKRILNMIDYYRKVMKITKIKAEFHKPDVIYASSVHPLTLVAGIKIAKRFGVPCVCEIRDLWPLSLIEYGKIKKNSILAKMLYLLEKWTYKNADRLIFTMEGGKKYIANQGWDQKINRDKIYHLNNNVDLDEYQNNLKKHILNDLDLDSKETFKVVYTGSIGVANNVENIIKVASNLKKIDKNIVFLIYGDGPKKKSLEKLVIINELNNVIFKGKVDKEYIPFILSKCDLNIITGRNSRLFDYGISLNKMFDYFASGKPVISDLNCDYDIIAKYECGVTVQNSNPIDMGKAILDFKGMSKSDYKKYSDNSLFAASQYDTKKLTNKLIHILFEG